MYPYTFLYKYKTIYKTTLMGLIFTGINFRDFGHFREIESGENEKKKSLNRI